MDRSLKLGVLRNSRELGFYVTVLLEYVHLMFLRTSKREKREYILFDVVKWVVQTRYSKFKKKFLLLISLN